MSTEINLINKIVVLDEGTIITSDVKSLNFTGPGVTATSSDGDVTIDITGGGGGSQSLQDVVNVSNSIGNYGGIGTASIQSTNFTNNRTLYLNDDAAATIKIIDNLNASNTLTIDVDTLSIDGVSYTWSNIVNQGTLTSVTASSPLSSTGGTTPDISIQQASALQAGYLSSTDWTTFNNKVSSSLLGANNGVATLDGGGKVPVTQLPNSIMDYKGTYNIVTNTPTLVNGTGNAGDVYINTAAGTRDFGAGPITVAIGDWLVYDGSVWQKTVNSNAVASVNGYTGIVVLNKSDIGLSNVENTALSTWAGSTNITTVGTIGSGTWQGTPIADSYLSSAFVKTNGTTPLTANWNSGSFRITTGNLTSTGDILVNSINIGKGTGTGTQNVGVGNGTLQLNTTGVNNTALGYQSLLANTIGSGTVAIGHGAARALTVGSENVIVGSYAFGYAVSARYNVAIGTAAMSSNTTGEQNTAIGWTVLGNNTTGYYNTAVGYLAVYKSTTASYNTGIGQYALSEMLTGGENVALGYSAGSISSISTGNTSGTQSVFLGAYTITGGASDVNSIVIGYRAVGKGSNTTVIGKQDATTDTWLAGYLHINERYKLPNVDGTANQVLQTNGAGVVSWATVSGGGGGTVSSVGLSMPSAFTVTNSPVTGTGVLTVTGAGTTTQYVRGDGTLGVLPSSGGAGGGTVYYLNGNTSQGVISGTTMYQLSKSAGTGAAANFNRSTVGTLASFITDAGDPNQLIVPAGIWLFQCYLSETGGGATHAEVSAIVEKWDGSTITVLGTGTIEEITNGSVVDLYSFGVSIPAGVTLSLTDRIVIQLQVSNPHGKTVTLYTENSNISSVSTTFANGIASLNGLTASAQTFATGTSGTDFGISSSSSIHTFNLPTASATNRGALSSADWSTFNGKVGGSGTTNYLSKFTAAGTIGNSVVFESGGNVLIGSVANSGFTLDVNTTSGTSSSVRVKGGSTGSAYFGSFNGSNTTLYALGDTASLLGGASDTSATLYTYIGIDMNFFIGGANRMKILNTGNIGIGTTTPTASLHINNIGTGNSFLVEDSTNPDTTPFLIDTDGNVAVGSSAAYSASKLDIYAGNTAKVPLSLRRADSAADHMVFVKEDTNTQWWIALTSDDFRLYNSTATDNILFGVNGGSADTGNKVGIGTATPSAKLDVNGNVKISTIANATTDTDKFLVSDSGVIKYRTGTEVLSDIGGISLSSISANTPLSYNSGTGAFSIQIATAAQNGYLSFANWTTFNNKIGGSGTANFISKFTASGTIGNSLIQDDGTGLSIGIASPYPGVRFYVANPGIAIVGSGTTYGVQGKGGQYGVWGESTSDEVGNHVGVYGSAGDIDGGGATYIGGRFVGGGANGTNYSLWLQDNTEGVGKFLKSITSDGKANWATLTVADTGLTLTTTGSSGAATLVGNTLNIPQYTGGTGSFDYGLSYAMASQNILL